MSVKEHSRANIVQNFDITYNARISVDLSRIVNSRTFLNTVFQQIKGRHATHNFSGHFFRRFDVVS